MQSHWISVLDRMPERDGRYLVVELHPTQWIDVCALRNKRFDFPVTHWMELPKPPEEKK